MQKHGPLFIPPPSPRPLPVGERRIYYCFLLFFMYTIMNIV